MSTDALELYLETDATNRNVQFFISGTGGTCNIDWGFGSPQINTFTLQATLTSYFRGLGTTYKGTIKIYPDPSNVNAKITQLQTVGVNGGAYFKRVDKFGARIENINLYGAANITYVAPSIPSTLTNLSNLFNSYNSYTSQYSIFADASNSLASWDVSNVTNMNTMFYQAINFNKNISSWNTRKVTDFSNMFYGATSFNNGGVPLTWSLSDVSAINMSNMFQSASSFNQDLSWNTINVTNMGAMFYDARAFNGNISNWNTSKVTDMTNMFFTDLSFNSGGAAGVSGSFNWDVSQVTGMQNMFYNCQSFNRNISTWQTSKVTHMGAMFYNAKVFNQDISGWDVSNVRNMNSMFAGDVTTFPVFNQNIGRWVTTNVTDMTSMFQRCSSFNSGGSSTFNWDVQNVTSMSLMFYFCVAFNQDISGWVVSKVTNMSNMFSSAVVFNRNLSNWNVSKCINFGAMFNGATSFNNGGVPLTWTLSNVSAIDMTNMFRSASSFNQDLSWNTINVTSMGAMFYDARAFNGNISNWDTRNVNTMNAMLGSPASPMIFNKDVSNWNTGNVTDMTNMFLRANSFNSGGAAGVSGSFNWDVSKVTSMTNLFLDCNNFNRNISTWQTSNVLNMVGMFYNARVFNQDISGWVVSKVTDFSSMFNGATSFNNGAAALTTNTAPLTWTLNTAGALKTINMINMFYGANSFSQDISSWNIKNVSTMTTMFTLNTTSMTKDLFNAMLTKWGVTDPSVNVPKTPFTFSTIKYTSGGSAGLTALQAAPYSWTVTANLVTYTPTSVFSGSSFDLNYSVASTPPVTGRSYTLVNTASPSTVLSTYVATAGDASYNFTGVTISSVGYASFMIIDTAINAIVDVVQVNGRFPCLKEGTKILTNKGYVSIENLRKGDLIKTPVNDYKAVYMIGKTEIYNHALPERETHQLYKCSPENYPEVFEDLILTGCHSILVDEFANEAQREKTRKVNGDLYVTRVNYGHMMGGKYRLPACADERALVYEKEGPFTIYHIALENSNYYHNYGIYANGLLVETCSQRYLNELSHMDSVE
jgi:surface protein